jgi:hypothetical protein
MLDVNRTEVTQKGVQKLAFVMKVMKSNNNRVFHYQISAETKYHSLYMFPADKHIRY